MRIPRVYLQQDLASSATITVSGQTAHHVTHVLRLRERATLRVFNGDGNEYAATFTGKGRGEITLEIGAALDTLPESGLAIRLAQGIARNDRMDLILQKSVELGVSEIQPLWMQRSQSHLRGERLDKRIRHWQGVISSACEQCGRATLPTLQPPLACPDWLAGNHNSGLGLMLQPDSQTVLADLANPHGTITLLVGPEGGMNGEEKAQAGAAGFTGVRLGARILRTETAALAALSGIQTLWGDFR
ncbi:MAG: 16S rRNA (uracil(1498)-N(3))-methyltransferase [Gammaproteobacteria bacterium]|nr:16S rRNA (uracil(1498)-N(3))-methyltransferase [Gammaproteobacteria bacterium]